MHRRNSLKPLVGLPKLSVILAFFAWKKHSLPPSCPRNPATILPAQSPIKNESSAHDNGYKGNSSSDDGTPLNNTPHPDSDMPSEPVELSPAPAPVVLPELPYDVWHLIASFLPADEPSRFYGLNQQWFDIAMRDMYETVHVFDMRDDSTSRCAHNMSKVAAPYVRNLLLRPHVFGPHLTDNENHIGSEIVWNHQKNQGYKLRMVNIPLRVAAKQIIAGIGEMSNVNTIAIRTMPSDDLRKLSQAMPIIESAWKATKTSLRELQLELSLESYEEVFKNAPIHDSLDRLSVMLRIHYVADHGHLVKEYSETVAGIVDARSASLTHFGIDVPALPFNPRQFLDLLGAMPKLRSFSAVLPIELMEKGDPTGVDDFLRLHANQLHSFKISYLPLVVHHGTPTAEPILGHKIFKVDLPVLKSLDIRLLPWEAHQRTSMVKDLSEYLKRVSSTLTSLTLHGYTLTLAQLKSILEPLQGRRSFLSTLKIDVRTVSYDLFNYLYTYFKHLEVLELQDFKTVGVTIGEIEGGSIGRIDGHWPGKHSPYIKSFEETMKKNKYEGWKLSQITLIPHYQCSGRWSQLRRILARVLPKVVISYKGSQVHGDNDYDSEDESDTRRRYFMTHY
ncbi:hypothetical protein BJ165DRAFT_285189 [Panaeolus papilionaceus]|nr:hypothetical protein BJ165DRAFT_285189 [Panaeolus papilionaceus]